MELLSEYVAAIASNGISQHSELWHVEKQFTIGGSSIAAILGLNPYGDKFQIIRDRIGLSAKNYSNLSCQWGNLFEELIKVYFEKMNKCTVLGEDLYIRGEESAYWGHPNARDIAYSPDGLTVCNGKIVLCEFKCPQSRIPVGGPPKYYVPQVKMGLDMIPIAEIGVLVEAVYRRCTWDQLGLSGEYDLTLVPRPLAKKPSVLAYGIIGFYYVESANAKDNAIPTSINWPATACAYMEKYGANGDETNDFTSNDLGDCDVDLFKMLMNAYDAGVLAAWYGPTHVVNGDGGGTDAANAANAANTALTCDEDLAAFTEFCRAGNKGNFGILPWKLFQYVEHWIEKTPDFLVPWMDEINRITNCVRECNDGGKKDNSAITAIYNQYIENEVYG